MRQFARQEKSLKTCMTSKTPAHQVAKLAKSAKTDEYLTPEFILEFARCLMDCDRFDCDAATTQANPTKAKKIYTKKNSGLTAKNHWYGKVWANPPFSLNRPFAEKLVAELESDQLEQLVYLAKADYRTIWSHLLLSRADWIFIYQGYIQFGNSDYSAVFSVVLYGYNLAEESVQKALKLHPKFIATKSYRV